jgi:5-methylthioribose kinase
MSAEGFLVTAANVQDYLLDQKLVPSGEDLSVRELGGGVSNTVLLVGCSNFRWVVKQSLEKLRVKDDWRSDRARVLREAESIQALQDILGEGALPKVVHVDRENCLFIMTAAPVGAVPWKDLLLGRRADLAVARQAAVLLGRLINSSRGDAWFRDHFADRRVFDQLRLDPYYRTAAARHNDVSKPLRELIADSLKIQTSLVHGDYSPKNMLVQGDRIFLIDFEVIHWGDPSFDAAFLLNHLFLKALYQTACGQIYIDAAREFWLTLHTALGPEGWIDFSKMTFRHVGGLMLARIDGKSPVEYIRDESMKERVRQIAKRIIQERPDGLEQAVEVIRAGGWK